MCPSLTDTIYNIFWGDKAAQDAAQRGADTAAQAARDAADTQAAAYRDAAQISADAQIRAAELAAAGLMEAASIAAEESRAAREQAIAYLKQATASAQRYLDSTLGSAEPAIRQAQQEALALLDEFGDKSADLYRPYIGAGTEALARYQELANKGVTLRGGQIVRTTTAPGSAMSFDDWKAQKLSGTPGLNYTGGSQTFNEETGQYEGVTDEQLQAEYQQYVDSIPQTTTTTTEETPYDIEKSPYYPLYQYQKEQQQKAIDAQLSARGLYRSGKGIDEQIKADTGLTESFTATEYQRAVDDYNRQLAAQGTLMGLGYESSGNLANIYNAMGANKANVAQWAGGSVANLRAQVGAARANAALGQGTSMANVAQQSGSQLANIYSQMGTSLANVQMGLGQGLSNTALQTGAGLANSAGQLGTNLANIYISNGQTQAALLNQQAQNRQNMFSGAAQTALYGYMRNRNQNPNTSDGAWNYNGGSSWNSNDWGGQGWNSGPGDSPTAWY